MILYHYTCDHGAPGITRDGLIKPNVHPPLPVPLIWLTTMEHPDRFGLGLTSQTLKCDRTEWRVRVVDADAADPWHVFARRWRISRAVRDELESGRWPMAWWVALDPIAIDRHAVQPTAVAR